MLTNKEILKLFVGDVLARTELNYKDYQIYDLNEFDGRRIYVALDNGDFDYTIRLWNYDGKCIRFTLFKDEDEGFEGYEIDEGAEEIISGSFCYYIYKDFD